MAGPIEVFLLEKPGSLALSAGMEKKDALSGTPRHEKRGPMAKSEARIRPREASKPVEHKADLVQTAAQDIAVPDSVARNQPDGGILASSGPSASGQHEGNTPFSAGSGECSGGGSSPGTGQGETDTGFGAPGGPRFLHREIPEYPYLARKRKKQGRVILSVVIDASGRLAKADVMEASDEAFANASLEALKKSTFLPAERNGQPVTSRAVLPVRFSLAE